jgi:signal transduction histidine kinase
MPTVTHTTEHGPQGEPLERFLAAAEHELRGALANAKSYASLLARQQSLPEGKARHVGEVVERNVDRALHLVTGLLTLWRTGAGIHDAERSDTLLQPFLDEALEQPRMRASQAGVRLVVQAPEVRSPLGFDPGATGKVLDAFLTHALGRSRTEQVVHLLVSTPDGFLSFEVDDQGSPLRDDEAKGYFEPTSAVSPAGKLTSRFDLVVAAAWVRAQGGVVRAATRGAQSAFSFALPTSLGGEAPDVVDCQPH